MRRAASLCALLAAFVLASAASAAALPGAVADGGNTHGPNPFTRKSTESFRLTRAGTQLFWNIT